MRNKSQFPYIKHQQQQQNSSNHTHQQLKVLPSKIQKHINSHQRNPQLRYPQTQKNQKYRQFNQKHNIILNKQNKLNSQLQAQQKEPSLFQELQISSINQELRPISYSGRKDLKLVLSICSFQNKDFIKYKQQKHEIIPINSSSQINKQQFSNNFIQRGKILSVRIIRINSGFNYFLPQFDMSFVQDFKHIMSCKKQIGAHSTYNFSISKQNFQQKGLYIGKIRGSFLGDIYNIYGKQQKIIKSNKVKQILCTSIFKNSEQKCLPKIYQIYVLNQNVKFWHLEGIDDQKGLDKLYKIKNNKDKISKFQTRKPQYCRSLGQFNLNFNGRVTRGSVKNFILEDKKSGRQVLMFGKNGDDIFNMDISYPLTPFIGLGLIIPYFSVKIFCD